MAKLPRLHERDWQHEQYRGNREMQINIIRHKLIFVLTADSRKPDMIEARLINSAAVLILSLHEREREFAVAQPPQTIARDYVSLLRELKSILGQLGLNGKEKGKGNFGLHDILSSTP